MNTQSSGEEPSGEQRASEIEPLAPASLKLLIVDDSEDIHILLRSFLRGQNIDISSATDGSRAIELAREQSFDLILMDRHMPALDGLSATRAIRDFESESQRSHTPIIAVSGDQEPADDEQARSAGCDGVLHKPVRKTALLDTIEQYTRL